jgi:hypothetical protein
MPQHLMPREAAGPRTTSWCSSRWPSPTA